jgi:glucose-6-phosphate isomerase
MWGEGYFLRRCGARDPGLWKPDEASARVIRNRMGWLSSADRMMDHVDEIRRVAEGVGRSGIRHVVLLGMGGSSLCPDVLRQTFPRVKGYPELLVLDSTDPGAVRDIERAIRPERSLFIVASKSGTTTESQMFFQYFHDKVRRAVKPGNPGDHFIAITDPGTPLEELARAQLFRHCFLNPPDIGGRYSALSYFGMVPAAIIGLDIARLLDRGERMIQCTRPSLPIADCPPVALGAALGALSRQGRDKVTFVTAAQIATFGYWVEQLIAESTGKEGKGIVPVEGEALGPPSSYGSDRVFVHLKLRGRSAAPLERSLAGLQRAGHPVITIQLEDLYDLGTEFNRWEIATAAAGSIMKINPFDEPNVKESKDNTNRVLAAYRKDGRLPSPAPALTDQGIEAFGWIPRHDGKAPADLRELLAGLCGAAKPGDYIALMAWLPMRPEIARRLAKLRQMLRARCRVATTLGFGPRFLHSTGQLHKGGAGNGLFVQITADKRTDVPIPGEPFTFGVLQAAQAAGDFESLSTRKLRAVRLHLGVQVEKDLDKLAAALAAAGKN